MLNVIKKSIRKVFNYETWLTLCALFKVRSGIKKSIDEHTYVVSLTSIPSRLNKVHVVIESLLSQNVKPIHVVLWLSEFNREGVKVIDRNALPLTLRKQQKRGLKIQFCDDIRSYRKLLPALEKYPESHIVTADDDIIYPKDWLEKLINTHKKHLDCIICYRGVEIKFNDSNVTLEPYLNWPEYTQAFKPSYTLFPQGGEGTIYPKGAFNRELFNKDVFMRICLTADDVWFKSMSLLNGTQCVKITERHQDFLRVRESQGQETLHFVNNIQGQNDVQISAVFDKYDLLKRLNNDVL